MDKDRASKGTESECKSGKQTGQNEKHRQNIVKCVCACVRACVRACVCRDQVDDDGGVHRRAVVKQPVVLAVQALCVCACGGH